MGTPISMGSGRLGPFWGGGNPKPLFLRATMAESCLGDGGQQPDCVHGVSMPRSPERGTPGPFFHKADSRVPCWREGRDAQPQFPAHPKCPSTPESSGQGGAGRGMGRDGAQPGLTPAGRSLAGRVPGSSPGPSSPPPAPRAPPDPRGRARRRPMSALAVSGSRAGSARLALGTRWAAAGGAWGSSRLVGPGLLLGNGAASFPWQRRRVPLTGWPGRRGGAGAGRPRRPQQQRAAPAPPGSSNLHTRRPLGPRGHPRPRPAPTLLRSSLRAGRPAAPRARRRPPPHRGKPGLRPCSEKLSPSQLPLSVLRHLLPQNGIQDTGEGSGSAVKPAGTFIFFNQHRRRRPLLPGTVLRVLQIRTHLIVTYTLRSYGDPLCTYEETEAWSKGAACSRPSCEPR